MKQTCQQIGLLSSGGYESMLEADRRVYSTENLAPTITTVTGGNKEIKIADGQRIRKLTERECLRLMDFDDSDIDKILPINARTQLYHQAGNSIVVSVLEAIFKEML